MSQLDIFRQPPDPPLVAEPTAPQPTAASRCLDCGHTSDDVMYGICSECFARWQAENPEAA